MDMPKPTEHHLKMEKLAGHWQGEERMHPSQWDPSGGVAIGRTSARVSLNGFVVVSDYQQEREGQVTYAGHGVWTYDARESCYRLHWFDSMGSPPEVFMGVFDGDVLTVSHAGTMHARMTYDFSQGKRMKTRMEMSPDGKTWSILFDATYEKK
jgi:hypothetical protein